MPNQAELNGGLEGNSQEERTALEMRPMDNVLQGEIQKVKRPVARKA